MKTFNEVVDKILWHTPDTYECLHKQIMYQITSLSHDNLLALFHNILVDELAGDMQCRLYEMLEESCLQSLNIEE